MGIKSIVSNVGNKAGNTIAKMASLSPAQLQEVENNRQKYMNEMPDPKDKAAVELTSRLMAANGIEIFNAYLPQISKLYLPVENETEYSGSFNEEYNIRYLNITKWVTDRKENNLEKLVNVYEVLSNEECNIALIFQRKYDKTLVYLAVVNTKNDDNSVDVNSYQERLINAIRGNFPGSEWNKGTPGVPPCFDDNIPYSIATASNIPTAKSEKFMSQTIEKLLDGCIPEDGSKEYVLILLATPVLDVEERKLRLSEIYSGLAPYASWTTDYHYTESNSTGSSANLGVNVGVSAGIQNGQNQSVSNSSSNTDHKTVTQTDSENKAESTSETKTETQSRGTSETESVNHTEGKNSSSSLNVGVGFKFANASIGHSSGKLSLNSTGNSASESISNGVSESVNEGTTSSVGKAIANSLGKSLTKGISRTEGVFKSINLGSNFGASFARSSSVTATIGKNEGITQTYTNYSIKHALELLEKQMQRYEKSSALGMWDFAAYVISEDLNIANNVAHSYVALTQGEESFMSQAAINLWRGDLGEESQDAEEIYKYLKELRHPVFGLNPEITDVDSSFNVYPSVVTATTSLSGKELAYSLNFPKKSVPGLPVIECTEFGRNVVTYDYYDKNEEKIHLGHIFHMNHEEKADVNIVKKSLASHTFITGSTGSGKSNTVFQILDEARQKDTRFMVIEPVKGEYKEHFGNDKNVAVYGTNPKLTPLLRIDPFRFPDEIHVLEHLDRLVEIFNVCWPMYAAMPAVLKNAVEKSYSDCGWDLKKSVNTLGEKIFPTFADVAKNVKILIDSSEYDTENKGAYKGALLTRLQSLTNGINGLIFVPDALDEAALFDENVLVDLSRVGSSETKSLIMGMLVLKLQEYRMTTTTEMNSPLKHITVLEEAHNLLKRTPIENSGESGNLQGKSVEMLANSIAEMRTYGEGFIIVDQAPGLLDMSTIRNTNTKIIMRLPDLTDRELVGKAANLNEEQIIELAKLPCGVAAVYQNEWIQPVLCKVQRYAENQNEGYIYSVDQNEDLYGEKNHRKINEELMHCIMECNFNREEIRREFENLKEQVLGSDLSNSVKCDLMEYLNADQSEQYRILGKFLYDFFEAGKAIQNTESDNIDDWCHAVVERMIPSAGECCGKRMDCLFELILQEQAVRDATYNDLWIRYEEIMQREGRVF